MIIAVLQARVSSTRLPGKVLKPILGVPMLEHHLERLSEVRCIDRLIVATSIQPDDDPIVELCRRRKVECFRGKLDDVLDRYYRAVESYRPDAVVRLTGDCPLADPEVIDEGIEYFCNDDYDYVSNCVERTYPIGLDAEIFRFEALRQAWREAQLPSEREHVTPFIKNHPERFVLGQFKNDIDLSHHRWTVDEPEDFEFVRAVYQALYLQKPRFSMHDILYLLERQPELTRINYHIVHGAGYQKSLNEDDQWRAGRKALPKQ
jgi:spore coat polysaccharide biosynthesis protein SpsF